MREGIRLDILISGSIRDGKLEPGEEEGPASLSGFNLLALQRYSRFLWPDEIGINTCLIAYCKIRSMLQSLPLPSRIKENIPIE